MKKSAFNPEQQEKDVSSKIVAGLERISEVFRILLWDKAKVVGLSPIQIQLLIFIAFHEQELCNVSQLAKEFNLTKPTISDAIRVLDNKGLIIKEIAASDSRRFSIKLSAEGKAIVRQTYDFANPLQKQVESLSSNERKSLFGTLSELIYKLNQSGILDVQRICYSCNYYEKKKGKDYCRLLDMQLLSNDIRIDCPEYEDKLEV